MANMSYCRFQNTYSYLCDCYENMDDELSEDETKYRKRIIELCKRIADCYGDEEEYKHTAPQATPKSCPGCNREATVECLYSRLHTGNC